MLCIFVLLFLSAWDYSQNSTQWIQTHTVLGETECSGSWHSAFQIFIFMSHLIQLRWAYTHIASVAIFCLKFGRSDVDEAGNKKSKWGSG